MSLSSLLWETVYEFSPVVKAAISSGQLEQVTTAAGYLLPIARNPATGAFVEIAKAGTQLAGGPVIAMAEVASSVLQTGVLSFQMDRGFQRTYQEIGTVQKGINALGFQMDQGFQKTYQEIGVVRCESVPDV